MPYGRIAPGEGVAGVMEDIVAECLAVAQADGVTVPGDMSAAVAGIARSMATQISSTAHDVARGKPSEIDHINGYVVRRGEALGIATPVNRVLHSVVKLLESRAGQAPG
jgi:2-dehydropantoate 2-reductase